MSRSNSWNAWYHSVTSKALSSSLLFKGINIKSYMCTKETTISHKHLYGYKVNSPTLRKKRKNVGVSEQQLIAILCSNREEATVGWRLERLHSS
jgi:hypothetical protein